MHMTKKFNYTAAKVLAICSIAYSILLILLHVKILLIGDKGFGSSLLNFLIPYILQGISYLFLTATFSYLACFFRLIGYKGASICIYLFVGFSLLSFTTTVLYLYQIYNLNNNGLSVSELKLMERILVFIPYILLIMTYVSGIILAIVIRTTSSGSSISRLVKPVGIGFLIYSIACFLIFILNLLFFNLIFSSYIAELDTESLMMVMRYRAFIHLIVITIPIIMVYIAIVKMYSKYQKMMVSNEEEPSVKF